MKNTGKRKGNLQNRNHILLDIDNGFKEERNEIFGGNLSFDTWIKIYYK